MGKMRLGNCRDCAFYREDLPDWRGECRVLPPVVIQHLVKFLEPIDPKGPEIDSDTLVAASLYPIVFEDFRCSKFLHPNDVEWVDA